MIKLKEKIKEATDNNPKSGRYNFASIGVKNIEDYNIGFREGYLVKQEEINKLINTFLDELKNDFNRIFPYSFIEPYGYSLKIKRGKQEEIFIRRLSYDEEQILKIVKNLLYELWRF